MIRYFKYYFIVLNLLGFLSMYIDKEKAKANRWRIKENTLLLIALLGGSIGSYMGMKHLDIRLSILNLNTVFLL